MTSTSPIPLPTSHSISAEADFYIHAGQSYLNKGQYHHALDSYRLGVEILLRSPYFPVQQFVHCCEQMERVTCQIQFIEKRDYLLMTKTVFGSESLEVALAYEDLGSCYEKMGDRLGAIECFRGSLFIWLQRMDNHLKVIYCLYCIGLNYLNLRNYSFAISNFQDAIQWLEKTPDGTRDEKFPIQLGLTEALSEALMYDGRESEIFDHLKALLREVLEVKGELSGESAYVFYKLADYFDRNRHTDWALVCSSSARRWVMSDGVLGLEWTANEKIFQRVKHQVLHTPQCLPLSYERFSKELVEASEAIMAHADELYRKKAFREVILKLTELACLYRKELGENHPSEAIVWNNIGCISFSHGLYSDAMRSFIHALLMLIYCDPQHFAIKAALSTNLGKSLLLQGRLDGAFYNFETAKQLIDQVYGGGHLEAIKIEIFLNDLKGMISLYKE